MLRHHMAQFERGVGEVIVFDLQLQSGEAFGAHDQQAQHLMGAQLALPAYEQVLKAAHTFNLLDARGAISVTERAAYIGRIRNLARAVAQSYYESRERLGFPMAPREWVEQMPKKTA